jgi:hypothetical protein
MATENKDDDKTELVVVEAPPEGGIEKAEEGPPAGDEGKDEKEKKEEKEVKPGAEEEHEDDEDDDEEGDKRASSEAEASDEKKKKDRESSADRRQRQREARERLERELHFYRGRNEQLERRFSAVEQRQVQAERLTIQQAIEQTELQLAEAKKIEAEAIREADGASAVEARDIATALENKRTRLLQAKARAERAPTPQANGNTPPPAMKSAFEWIKKNEDWYDPQMGNEDSVLAAALEDKMYREGKINPQTPEFWAELDKRLKARGIGKKVQQRDEVDEDEAPDDNAASDATRRSGNSKPAGERKDARKSNGGPKISVNGANRALKANEVYVSPERKAAMIELGAWDDPVLKQKLLRDYQRYDREAAARR